MIRLNVTALTRLTYAAVPGFVARGNGTIINISSIVAIAPEMLNGVYGGTKAFVLALTHSLVHELADKGVRVQAVLPGATATEFWDVAGLPVHQLPPQIVMSADDLVDAALAGLDLGETVTIPSLPNKARMGSLRGGAPRHVGQAFERHSGPSLQLAQPRTAQRLAKGRQNLETGLRGGSVMTNMQTLTRRGLLGAGAAIPILAGLRLDVVSDANANDAAATYPTARGRLLSI